jgi:hypothetical protein
MGKSRMMGAGHASSSLYKCSPNLPTGGGNKKQGITSRVGLNNWDNREIQTQSNGIGRFKLYFVNQLGGIEPGHSMFGGRWNRADGIRINQYIPQLTEEIKQDQMNEKIIPVETYTPKLYTSLPSNPRQCPDGKQALFWCYTVYNGVNSEKSKVCEFICT